MRKIGYLLSLLLLVGCGGQSGDEKPAVPELVVFYISGHTDIGDGSPSHSYLHESIGPEVSNDLRAAGYSVVDNYYVDDAFAVEGRGGFLDLVDDLIFVRDEFVPHGTRVVVIAHSHGGVWAHAAMQQVDDLEITCAVDLDTNSYGWGFVDHTRQNDFIGGDPRDRFYIPFVMSYPQYPDVPSEQTPNYDLDDVVFPNVQFALEVRAGETAPGGDEWYDEKWNIRVDGQTHGLYGYYSDTSHSEVHQPEGATVSLVKAWLQDRLAAE